MVELPSRFHAWTVAIESGLEDISDEDKALTRYLVQNVFSRWKAEAFALAHSTEHFDVIQAFDDIIERRQESALGAIAAIVEVIQAVGRGEDPEAVLREHLQ